LDKQSEFSFIPSELQRFSSSCCKAQLNSFRLASKVSNQYFHCEQLAEKISFSFITSFASKARTMWTNHPTAERQAKEEEMLDTQHWAEEERKERFEEARERILGVDCDTLDRQQHEREAKWKKDHNVELMEAEELKHNIEVADGKDLEIREETRQHELEMHDYRKMRTEPAEYEWSDAYGKQPSEDHSDPRMRVFGSQAFTEEDFCHQRYEHAQQVEQKDGLEQQIAEKKSLAADKKKSDKIAADVLNNHDMFAVSLTDQMHQDKREVQRQIGEYNQLMAQQKRDNDKKRKKMELEDDYYYSSSEMQAPQDSSSSGYDRCVPYQNKCMTSEQVDMENRDDNEDISEQQHREMTLKERELTRSICKMNHEHRDD